MSFIPSWYRYLYAWLSRWLTLFWWVDSSHRLFRVKSMISCNHYVISRRLVSSVGRAPVCWARGHGFKPGPDQRSATFKELRRKCRLCSLVPRAFPFLVFSDNDRRKTVGPVSQHLYLSGSYRTENVRGRRHRPVVWLTFHKRMSVSFWMMVFLVTWPATPIIYLFILIQIYTTLMRFDLIRLLFLTISTKFMELIRVFGNHSLWTVTFSF